MIVSGRTGEESISWSRIVGAQGSSERTCVQSTQKQSPAEYMGRKTGTGGWRRKMAESAIREESLE